MRRPGARRTGADRRKHGRSARPAACLERTRWSCPAALRPRAARLGVLLALLGRHRTDHQRPVAHLLLDGLELEQTPDVSRRFRARSRRPRPTHPPVPAQPDRVGHPVQNAKTQHNIETPAELAHVERVRPPLFDPGSDRPAIARKPAPPSSVTPSERAPSRRTAHLSTATTQRAPRRSARKL